MKNWRTAAAKKILSYVLVLATAMLPFAAQANSLVNDPFVRDAANRRNFEPGGKYHLFGSRGITANRKGTISVIPASSQTVGGLRLEQALIRGGISYDVRFSNHGHEVHAPFDYHASRQSSDKKGQALIGFTTYQLNWSGHEHHPADGYDGPQGGGFPAPTGARDEYSYSISGSAARVEVKFDDNRDTRQRFEDRFKNAADMAANGVKDAWKQAATHNPELNRVGNAAEAVSAAVSGVGSLAGSVWEGIGAGDAAQGIQVVQAIAGVEALRALPPEAQLKAVSAMTEAADGYDAANAAYARWAQQNPNAAAVVGAAGNVAEQVASRGKGTVSNKVSGSRRRAPEYDGGTINETSFINSAERWLGDKYHSLRGGRYVSEDGMRQVRYGNHETTTPVHHGHFEAYDKPANQGGSVIENTRVRIESD